MIKLSIDEDKALKAGVRKEKYIFELVNKYGIKKVELEVPEGNASISMSVDDEIKRRGNFVIRKNAMIDMLTDRIRPVMMIRMPNNKWARWPKGIYMLSTPVEKYTSGEMMIHVSCYDPSIILQQDTFDTKTVFTAGAKYTDVISAILISAGFNRANVAPNASTLLADLVLDDSKSKLQWLNELATEINYRDLFIDDYGIPNMIPYVIPSAADIEYTYRDDQFSVLTPEISIETDWWNVPNVIKRTVSRADIEPLTALYINDNPGDKLSTVSRGMRVVDYKTVNMTASQEDLQSYVNRLGFEARQVTQKVVIETLNMPHHAVHNTFELRRAEISGIFSEVSWNMKLSPGEIMHHEIKRLVV